MLDYAEWIIGDLERHGDAYAQLRVLLDDPQRHSLRGPKLTGALIAAATISDLDPGQCRGARRILADHPDLVEDELWDLFAHPGEGVALTKDLAEVPYWHGMQVSPEGLMVPGDGPPPPDPRWSAALVELAREDDAGRGRGKDDGGTDDGGDGAVTIPRGRLLDECLRAMSRDFSAAEMSWFKGVWDRLEVSDEERAARMDALLLLLGSPVPRVLAFALAQLRPLARSGLAEPSWIPALQAGTASSSKGSTRAALTLLDCIVKDHPNSASDAVGAALLALGHPDAEVQSAALDRVERWRGGEREDLAGELLRYLDLVSPTVRPRVENLVGLSQTTGSGDQTVHPDDTDSLAARVAALPAAVRRAAGLDEWGEGEREGDRIPTWLAGPAEGEPVLDPLEAVEPIATDEELDAALADLIADSDGSWQDRLHLVDRVRDAVLRRCDQPFPEVLLAHRAHLEADEWLPHAVRLAATWLDPSATGPYAQGLDKLLIRRVAAGDAGPLLSLPTHRGQRLAPQELVRRLRERAERPGARGADADPDLAIALTRLAPDHRAEALAAARDLDGRRGALLRHALGGPQAPPGTGVAWDAAEAVRTQVGRQVRIEHGWFTRKRRWGNDDRRFGQFVIDVDPPVRTTERVKRGRHPEGPVGGLAGALRHRSVPVAEHGFPAAYAEVDQLSGLRELAHAVTLNLLHPTLVGSGNDHSTSRAVENLLLTSEPMTRSAARLVLHALGSSDGSLALLAVDIIVSAVEDGRLGPEPLAEDLRLGLDSGVLKAARMAQRLGEVAAASPTCAAVVRRTLDAGLALQERPTSLVRLLSLLDELSAEGQVAVRTAGTRTFLGSFAGSSAAARSARRLLSHARPARDAGLLWRARVVRAERWARIARTG